VELTDDIIAGELAGALESEIPATADNGRLVDSFRGLIESLSLPGAEPLVRAEVAFFVTGATLEVMKLLAEHGHHATVTELAQLIRRLHQSEGGE
jgi:hypothetical protein